MSMTFCFYAAERSSDEPLDTLYEDSDLSRLRPDVIEVQPIDIPRYGHQTGVVLEALSINRTGTRLLDAATGGRFLAFTAGRANHRFLRLVNRLDELQALKEVLPDVSDEYLRLFLTALVENCEHVITAHRQQALLGIF